MTPAIGCAVETMKRLILVKVDVTIVGMRTDSETAPEAGIVDEAIVVTGARIVA
jgi:hypothetical protein